MPIGTGGGGGGSGIRAGRAYIELSLKGVRDVAAGLSAVKSAVGSMAGIASRIGLGLGAAGLAGGGLAAKLGLDKIADLSRQGAIADSLGLTAEQFTGVAGLARAAGEDTREFVESLVTLGKVASEGALGKGEVAGQFFKDINVNAKEFAALRPDEQFFKFFEAVRAVENPLTRVRALMTAFGEDGGKLLLPLLSKAPGELRAMAAGFASTGEEVRQAQAAQVAYAGATAGLERIWRSVVVGLAPAVERAAEAFTRAVAPAVEFVGANKELVAVGIGAAGALAAGAAAAGLMLPAVGSLAAAVGPLNIGLAALGGYLVKDTEAGQRFGEVWGETFAGIGAAAGGAFEGLREDFARTWGGLSAALKSGDIARAAEIGFAALELAWVRTLEAMRIAWAEFKFGLKETGRDAVGGAQDWLGSATNATLLLGVDALAALGRGTGIFTEQEAASVRRQAENNLGKKEREEQAERDKQFEREQALRRSEHYLELNRIRDEFATRKQMADQRLQAAVAGGTVGPAALALGGGMLAGIGTPGANAVRVADFFADAFPKRGGGTGLEALVGGFGAVTQATANRLAAASDGATTARGVFGGGRGDLSGVFGGGSPMARVAKGVEELVRTAKDVSKKFEDTNRKLDELGGEFA